MNILFVGSMVNENEISNLPAASVAGNKMQQGILRGLYKQDKNITALSVKPRAMYRFGGNGCIVNKHNQYVENGIKYIEIFYINFIILKQISIFISLLLNIIKWHIGNQKGSTLLAFNTISYMIFPCLISSKAFKSNCVGIVADLPIKGEKNRLQKLEDRLEIWAISKLDALIPLTKYIAADFAKGKPYLIVEAGHAQRHESIFDKEISTQTNIVFSGTLNVLSGIELAIDVMKRLDNHYILHIYGRGDREDIVKESVEKYSNILYHGIVDNQEMLKIQQQADILICPRLPDNYTTKYTFPSKVLEYMTSGVPVICNKLLGIADEYYQYINVPDKPDVYNWIRMIQLIRENNSGYYTLRAEKAQFFALEEKNWDKQCKKINDFIEKV